MIIVIKQIIRGLNMTTNDIEKAEILLCFKNGERALRNT